MAAHPYTQAEINKLGNTLVYLTGQLGKTSKTRLLKLLFLLEELSVKSAGLAFFQRPFMVWKFGPVLPDVYVELSGDQGLLRPFVRCDEHDGCRYFTAAQPFDDSEFSDVELALLDKVIALYGRKSADELVAFTHRPGSLWYETAQQKGVLPYLQEESLSTTEIEIDFSDLLSDEPQKKARYHDHLTFLEDVRAIKEHFAGR